VPKQHMKEKTVATKYKPAMHEDLPRTHTHNCPNMFLCETTWLMKSGDIFVSGYWPWESYPGFRDNCGTNTSVNSWASLDTLMPHAHPVRKDSR